MSGPWRSIGAGLLVLVSLLLTLKFKAALGWSPDLLVPTFAVLGFFLELYPLALFTLLGVWVLDWQTGLPPELWLVAAAPLVAYAGKRFLPSSRWFTLAAVIAIAELAIYVVAARDVFFANAGFILSNTAFAVLFGLSLMSLLQKVYGRS